MRILIAIVLLLCLMALQSPGLSFATPETDYKRSAAHKQQTIRNTQAILTNKLQVRRKEMKARMRTIYKLTRSSWPKLWFDAGARKSVAKWLIAARRIKIRDSSDVDMLNMESVITEAAEVYARRQALLSVAAQPAAGTLNWPVPKDKIVSHFGVRRQRFPGGKRRLHLGSRGIEIAARLGGGVRPALAGKVRYAGPVAGLGRAVIIQHNSCISILGHLNDLEVTAGQTVSETTLLGKVAGDSIYLEVRLDVGDLGHPVDPLPLLQ